MSFGVKSTIKVNNSALNKLRKRLENLAKQEGRVGFFEEDIYSDSGSDRDGLPVATIAHANNYGIEVTDSDIPIPVRPFFTLSAEEMARTFHADIKKVVRSVFTSTQYMVEFKNYLRGFRNTIQAEIISLDYPSNHPKTVKSKGSDNPLIDSGKMLKSVKYKVDKR